MVDRAEQLLLDLGFHQLRVRIHGTIARIELIPEEFRKIGFSYTALDILGYRTGSMNETIVK